MTLKEVKASETMIVEIPIPSVGDHVIFVDPMGNERNALVTCVHCNEHWGYAYGPCINLLFVSDDEKRSDPYGRQLERQSSVCNSMMPGLAHGNFWKLSKYDAARFSYKPVE